VLVIKRISKDIFITLAQVLKSGILQSSKAKKVRCRENSFKVKLCQRIILKVAQDWGGFGPVFAPHRTKALSWLYF